jgi:hypothetical protein
VVAAARVLQGQGVGTVLVKLGARGSLLIGGWLALFLGYPALQTASIEQPAGCRLGQPALPQRWPLPTAPDVPALRRHLASAVVQIRKGRCGGRRHTL